MKIEDMIALSKAGFNSQQIVLMAEQEKREMEQKPVELPKEEQKPIELPKEEPKPVELPKEEQKPATQDILDAIKGLQQTIQAGNVTGSQQPAKESTDDILAKIINP